MHALILGTAGAAAAAPLLILFDHHGVKCTGAYTNCIHGAPCDRLIRLLETTARVRYYHKQYFTRHRHTVICPYAHGLRALCNNMIVIVKIQIWSWSRWWWVHGGGQYRSKTDPCVGRGAGVTARYRLSNRSED